MVQSYDPSINLRATWRHAPPRASRLLARCVGLAAAAFAAAGVPAVAQVVIGTAGCSQSGLTYNCAFPLNSPVQYEYLVNTTSQSGTATVNASSSSGTFNYTGGSPFPSAIYVLGFGVQTNYNDINWNGGPDQPFQPYNAGPTVNLTNAATITAWNTVPATTGAGWIVVASDNQTTAPETNLGGVLTAISLGSSGIWNQGPYNYSQGNSSMPPYGGSPGGAVTVTNSGSIQMSGNFLGTPPPSGPTPGIPSGPNQGLPWMFAGIGAYSIGGQGGWYYTNNDCCVGGGGNGGPVSVTTTAGSSIYVYSSLPSVPAVGIVAASMGGAGAGITYGAFDLQALVGDGGSGGSVNVTNGGFIGQNSGGANYGAAIGILAASTGSPGQTETADGVTQQGQAGNGGAVTVNLTSTGAIDLGYKIGYGGTNGVGILAASLAGAETVVPTYGFNAGSGGLVTVNLAAGSIVSVTESGFAIGVLATSGGTNSVADLFGYHIVNNGGYGYSGGVNVTNDGTIATSGQTAVGIAALNVGGAAVVTNAIGTSTLGNTSYFGSGAVGSLNVTNNGTITTLGTAAFGILAESTGGGGGLLNSLSGSTVKLGGDDGGAGSGGNNGAPVSVTNTGTITTGDGNGGGKAAIGIVAQSIGGGGGSASGTSFIGGQSGNSGGDGSTVIVLDQAGTVTTKDDDAVGILAQSIGGGGGNGGDAVGVIAAVGGNGGNAGSGSAVTVTIGNSSGTTTTVNTSGDFAYGVIAQSVGGGGGNAGAAKSYGAFFSMAVGGSGGVAGTGGTVDVTNDAGGQIVTTGESAHGVIAQSIGGGGGNGGAANAYVAGFGFVAGIALGGSGGGGGDGGQVTVSNGGGIVTGTASVPSASTCTSLASACALQAVAANASGFDSVGILAQSIGGGGGNGGAATAKSLAVSVPGYPEFPIISADFTLGGSGGTGGNGNTVTVGNAGTVLTYGDGSHGVIAQSIGGGGGNGGDSSATATSIAGEGLDANVSVALGGSGGAAGTGGTVSVTNGGTASLGSITDCTSGCTGVIETFGNEAVGILAQSIGGGGGNGGLGDASANSPNLGGTLTGGETGKSLNLSIGVGGSGGAGSSGGAVTVYNDPGSSIITLGSGAQGILAQSIGGGGGNGGGGDTTGGGNTVNLDVKVGGSGGSGNNGSTVTVSNAGTISTNGGDGVGILAQSIGGGGGNGGTTDAAASLDWQGIIEDTITPPTDLSYKGTVAVGGSGGASGGGSTVSVINTGSITTAGERAYGIVAQSIGGGGGSGGAAATDSSDTFTFAVAVGGSGSGGGNGGGVSVINRGTISTTGFNADGIVAQSIGGGGGVGADGSSGSGLTISSMGILPTLTIGADWNGGGGAGGSGSPVTVDSTNGSISTAGDAAYGILAQSIGGGGGVGGAGGTTPGSSSSLPSVPALVVLNLGGYVGAWGDGGNVTVTGNTIVTAGADAYAILAQSIGGGGGVASLASDGTGGSLNLQVGGTVGANGNGNTVIVNQNGAIVTSGARSFGIVAQSIGGGGGIATNAATNISSTRVEEYPGWNSGTGGPVTVNLASSGSITTSGAGAWGILAQSIGGGGGFSGDPSLTLVAMESNTLSQAGLTGNASANTVAVTVNGNITTTGTNAHGIFAQSIGGSGGIVAGCCQSTTANTLAGNAAQFRGESNAIYWGNGGNIYITQGAGSTIRTSGLDSIGIIAQSSGNNATGGQIYVDIGGSVIGGTMTGDNGVGVGAAGILLSGGGNSSSSPNNITVYAGGSVGTVDGVSGTAITTGYGLTDVNNSGTITGNIELGSTPGTITNNAGGVLNTGATIVASSLTNAGTLNVGGTTAVGTTSLTGNYNQTSGGVLGVVINSLASSRQASMLTVSGTAAIAGQVVPTAINLLPGTYSVLTAGSLTSTVTPTTAPLLFNWSVATTPTTLTVSPSANFTPAGVTLTASQASMSSYFQTAWNNSDQAFARLFALLNGVTASNKAQAIAMYNSLSSKSTAAQSSALLASFTTMLEASMSCPVFVDQGTQLGEDSCVWERTSGWLNSQSASADAAGYKASGTTYRIGGQHVIAQDWFIGGSLGAGQSWTTMDGGSKGNGQTYDGSVALKHTMGPWLFAGSVAVANGAFQTNRFVSVPGLYTGVLKSNQNTLLVGGRLRAAYEFALEDWYVRPYADLDVAYLNTGGYQESGNSALALNVRGSDHTGVALTPMVELGLRRTLADGFILRPYVAAGLSYMPNNSRKVSASFVMAQASDGTFTDTIGSPTVTANVAAGVQLYRAGGFEVRAEYSLKAGFQSGSARLAYHF
jgi:uncharacterized protein YhjY with autotransporter beta-barrel domain